MNIIELQDKLKNLNIDITAKEICNIWGMDEAVFSRKKKAKSDVKFEKIRQLESQLQVKLLDEDEPSVILDFFPEVFGSCGNGVFAMSELREQITVPKKAFFTAYNPLKKYSVIRAKGNSMEPAIYDNDYLIVEHSNGEQIIDNKPYIFAYKNEIFIKRLAKNVNQLIIIPENKMYDIIKLTDSDMDDVLVIGQIVGLMRDLR
jgi:phage repressor protein C with HTH and peptisase S24 domain